MKLIIANWKSNKSREEVEKWLDVFEEESFRFSEVKVVICPPLPSLMFVSNRLLNRGKHPSTFLGVQDISPFPAGSYTGAVSARNLNGFKVNYSIVGHPERRKYFDETHQDVANKVTQCVENGITPVVCVDDEHIAGQATAIDREMLSKCIVSFEKLSSIGNGNNVPVDQVKEIVGRIKVAFGEVPVLYGGSVNKDNVKDYMDICSGVLVATASLDPAEFTDLINQSVD